MGPISFTQPHQIHLNNPTEPKQAEQVQCNIIEQFYVSDIQVTRT